MQRLNWKINLSSCKWYHEWWIFHESFWERKFLSHFLESCRLLQLLLPCMIICHGLDSRVSLPMVHRGLINGVSQPWNFSVHLLKTTADSQLCRYGSKGSLTALKHVMRLKWVHTYITLGTFPHMGYYKYPSCKHNIIVVSHEITGPNKRTPTTRSNKFSYQI